MVLVLRKYSVLAIEILVNSIAATLYPDLKRMKEASNLAVCFSTEYSMDLSFVLIVSAGRVQ